MATASDSTRDRNGPQDRGDGGADRVDRGDDTDDEVQVLDEVIIP